jgi:phosphoribosyl 1,2-cyclic phosphodiesterase
VSIEITAEPDIRRQPTPKSINFRINPDEHLLIIETTYPAHVQKIQSVFNNETAVDVAICGDLTVFPSQADESVTSFINEFRDEEDQITHE